MAAPWKQLCSEEWGSNFLMTLTAPGTSGTPAIAETVL